MFIGVAHLLTDNNRDASPLDLILTSWKATCLEQPLNPAQLCSHFILTFVARLWLNSLFHLTLSPVCTTARFSHLQPKGGTVAPRLANLVWGISVQKNLLFMDHIQRETWQNKKKKKETKKHIAKQMNETTGGDTSLVGAKWLMAELNQILCWKLFEN